MSAEEEKKFYTTDQYGRGRGYVGLTPEEMEEERLDKEAAKARTISGMIQLATTAWNIGSFIDKSIAQSLEPVKLMEGVIGPKKELGPLVVDAPRGKIGKFFPDLRPASQRLTFNPALEIQKADLSTAFSAYTKAPSDITKTAYRKFLPEWLTKAEMQTLEELDLMAGLIEN